VRAKILLIANSGASAPGSNPPAASVRFYPGSGWASLVGTTAREPLSPTRSIESAFTERLVETVKNYAQTHSYLILVLSFGAAEPRAGSTTLIWLVRRRLAILPNDRFAHWLSDEANPPRAAGAISRRPACRSAATIATLVGVPSGHGRMAWDQLAPAIADGLQGPFKTLPIIHKQRRRPIQAAIAIARAAIRP
jgi:hypothetical protein